MSIPHAPRTLSATLPCDVGMVMVAGNCKRCKEKGKCKVKKIFFSLISFFLLSFFSSSLLLCLLLPDVSMHTTWRNSAYVTCCNCKIVQMRRVADWAVTAQSPVTKI